jgi:hypothetical protein
MTRACRSPQPKLCRLWSEVLSSCRKPQGSFTPPLHRLPLPRHGRSRLGTGLSAFCCFHTHLHFLYTDPLSCQSTSENISLLRPSCRLWRTSEPRSRDASLTKIPIVSPPLFNMSTPPCLYRLSFWRFCLHSVLLQLQVSFIATKRVVSSRPCPLILQLVSSCRNPAAARKTRSPSPFPALAKQLTSSSQL